MTTIRRRKTKIQIQAKGCIQCGSEHSSGWFVAEQAKVTVGLLHCEHFVTIDLHICSACQATTKQRN